MSWSERLPQIGIVLPPAAKPVANYVPAVRIGNLVYTSVQLPFVSGKLEFRGKVSRVPTAPSPRNRRSVLPGSARSTRCRRIDALVGLRPSSLHRSVTGYVASGPGFRPCRRCSTGRRICSPISSAKPVHARSAVGVAELPLASPVEVELIVEVTPES